MNRNLTCLQPFTWLEIHRDGSAFCCCPTWRPRPLGNLSTQTMAEIWWGETARQFRAAAVRGNFLGCRSGCCPHLATRSGRVGPVASLVDPDLASQIMAGAGFSELPRQLKLSFDPRCNLHCPCCRTSPTAIKAPDQQLIARLEQRVVDELLPVVETLLVAGQGDPFAAPSYRRILARLDGKSAPRLKTIHLHSNGLLWSRETWEALPRLHGLVQSAEISVDAASSETYALNRRGGAFEVLLANLEYIAGLGIDVLLSFVVQANNLREMEAFCHLAERFGWRCYFSKLANWGTFSRCEYAERAVHRPAHPKHRELLEMLRRVSTHSSASLGNLAPLLAV